MPIMHSIHHFRFQNFKPGLIYQLLNYFIRYPNLKLVLLGFKVPGHPFIKMRQMIIVVFFRCHTPIFIQHFNNSE